LSPERSALSQFADDDLQKWRVTMNQTNSGHTLVIKFYGFFYVFTFIITLNLFVLRCSEHVPHSFANLLQRKIILKNGRELNSAYLRAIFRIRPLSDKTHGGWTHSVQRLQIH
jgi:hypothetical protein